MKKKLVKAWEASKFLEGLKGKDFNPKLKELFESKPKQKLN